MVGTLLGLTVCTVAFVHAIGESRAFANAASCKGPEEFDMLWLASCFAFLAFEVVAVGYAFISEGFFAWGAEVAIGLVACLTGVRIRCLAIARLGSGFALPPLRGTAPHLAEDNVYAVVRHPSELGLLLFCAGLVVIVPVADVICAFALLIVPFVALRIAREERWLRTHHKLRHADFRAAVPRLLCPRLRDLFALISLLARRLSTSAVAVEELLEAKVALDAPNGGLRSGFSGGGSK